MKGKVLIVLLSLGCILQVACYSFTQPTTGVASVKVDFVENRADIVNPEMSNSFTEALKDIITKESSIKILDKGAESHLYGFITKYAVEPVSSKADETAGLNRLKVEVKMTFDNKVNDKDSWESNFKAHADFDASLEFSAVESTLVEEINEEITQEVFKKAFVNW